jgi:hypothetical protein
MVTLGLSEKIACFLLLVTILPSQYLAYLLTREPAREPGSTAYHSLYPGAPDGRSHSVKDDWRAWLPEEKSQLFSNIVQTFEARYVSLSISLDEAFELRQARRMAEAYQVCANLGDSFGQLTRPLVSMLRALAEHVEAYRTIAASAPLDPANFQSIRYQRIAKLDTLLSQVFPLSPRLLFLRKVRTLLNIVRSAEDDFSAVASELAGGRSTNPTTLWLKLDTLHYDLNTSLRESIVILKSFLVVLPEEHVHAFKLILSSHAVVPSKINQSAQPSLGIVPGGYGKRRAYITYEDLAGVGKPS